MKENLRLPDDDQQKILKEFSQASNNVLDATRDISELMQGEISDIEKDVTLPFRNILPFDEILPDSEASMDDNYKTENSNEGKEDENYGSGEVNTQGEQDSVSYEASTTDDGKDYTERPSFQQTMKEVDLENNDVKNAGTRSGAMKKGTQSVTKVTINEDKVSPREGSDDDDDLDSPVVFIKKKHKNKSVHSDSPSASSGDLEELGDLVVDSKTGNDNGQNKGNSTVNEFSFRQDNVSKSNQIKNGAKLDVNASSPNGTYSTVYSMPQNDKNYTKEWSEKNQVNFDKPNERSKRSKHVENNEKGIGSKKNHVNDYDDDDYIRLKKSGIFENIANAFAHIDKTRKEKENERVEKRKKSTLEEIHESNPNQPGK